MVSVALAFIIYLSVHKTATDETTVGGFVSFLTACCWCSSPAPATGVNQTRSGASPRRACFDWSTAAQSDTGTPKWPREGKVNSKRGFSYPESARPAWMRVVFVESGETYLR